MNANENGVDSPVTIVVAMTCHNRRDLSIRIVSQILRQANAAAHVRFVAVDDGSSDGTGEALRALGVAVIEGDGSMYWAGGMREAHKVARSENPDLILWVNDDLDLSPDAIQILVAGYRATQGNTILAGAVESATTGEISYGGRNQSGLNPLSFQLSGESDLGKDCDTFNGNFVGIPRSIYNKVEFPAGYRHAYADLAFGMLAKKQGFSSQILPRSIGRNDRNPQTGKMFRHDVPLSNRVRFALSPFGLPPAQQWRFARLATGKLAPFWFIRSYARVFFPSRKIRYQE